MQRAPQQSKLAQLFKEVINDSWYSIFLYNKQCNHKIYRSPNALHAASLPADGHVWCDKRNVQPYALICWAVCVHYVEFIQPAKNMHMRAYCSSWTLLTATIFFLVVLHFATPCVLVGWDRPFWLYPRVCRFVCYMKQLLSSRPDCIYSYFHR